MKKNQVVLGGFLAVGLMGLLPTEARASGLEVHVGGMRPRAKSILFDDDVTLYQVRKKDFEGAFGGLEFTKNLAPNIELGLAVDGYGREIPTAYRDYTRPSGGEIEQTLRLNIVPVSAIVRLVPSGKYRTWTPYVGAGVSAMFWQYEEFGDFIDFGRPGLPVASDSFKSNGVTAGLILNAGLRYRINDDLQITADFRNFSGKQKMHGDFAPNEIDVSGSAVMVGVRLVF